jgi:hypothetical protein
MSDTVIPPLHAHFISKIVKKEAGQTIIAVWPTWAQQNSLYVP